MPFVDVNGGFITPTIVKTIEEEEVDNIFYQKIIAIEEEIFIERIIVDGGGIIPPDNIIEPIVSVDVVPEFITVDGKEYDLSHLTSTQKTAIKTFKALYENTSQEYRDITSFEVYIYNITQIKIFKRILEEKIDIDPEKDPFFEEMLDTDFESPWFQLKLLYYKLRTFIDKYKWLTPVIVVIGIIVVSLIGYQYTKSYVTQKAVKRASK